jgi:hypothetical protein
MNFSPSAKKRAGIYRTAPADSKRDFGPATNISAAARRGQGVRFPKIGTWRRRFFQTLENFTTKLSRPWKFFPSLGTERVRER